MQKQQLTNKRMGRESFLPSVFKQTFKNSKMTNKNSLSLYSWQLKVIKNYWISLQNDPKQKSGFGESRIEYLLNVEECYKSDTRCDVNLTIEELEALWCAQKECQQNEEDLENITKQMAYVESFMTMERLGELTNELFKNNNPDEDQDESQSEDPYREPWDICDYER
jgi:hypothetical protein